MPSLGILGLSSFLADAAAVGAIIGGVGGGIAYAMSHPCDDYVHSDGFWRAVGVGALSGGVAGLVGWAVPAILPAAGFWGAVGVGALSGSLAGGTGQVIVNLFTPNAAWYSGVPEAILVGGVTGGIAGGVGYGIQQWLATARPIGAGVIDCSFSADTLVATQQGEQAIGMLQEGDLVLAYDAALGITGSYTVTAVLVHVDPTIVYVTIDGEQLETTPEHPFFTQEYGWLPAGELAVGMHIRKANGEYGIVQAIEVVQRQQPMYNLTVAGAHTFFVGQQRWLVHNVCNPVRPYEVGTYDELAARSHGDTLQIHHVPQGAPASQVIPGYDYQRAPAIALPNQEHFDLNAANIKGNYSGSARDLMAKGLTDLRQYTGAPNSALQDVLSLARNMYPGVFR
jgi:hypothetical protein